MVQKVPSGNTAGADAGAGQATTAAAPDAEAISVGGLSADLEAELAADVSDGSPEVSVLPEQALEQADGHSPLDSKDAPPQVRSGLFWPHRSHFNCIIIRGLSAPSLSKSHKWCQQACICSSISKRAAVTNQELSRNQAFQYSGVL